MKPIGGYFELELPKGSRDFPHSYCTALNSGRHALEFILRQLDSTVKIVYLPYYTCDVVLEPLKRLNITYQFYHIDEKFEITDFPNLSEGHYLIANNYFGIKDEYIRHLHQKLGSHLIVDNAQAFFAEERPGMKAFFSPRKFVGIPDGGFAWSPQSRVIDIPKDFSADRCCHLLRRIDSGSAAGYQEFKENSRKLSKAPMKKMSELTYRILESIDFNEVIYRRRRNFDFLHKFLGATNLCDIPDMSSFVCPLVYPYYTTDDNLRSKLISNNVYVATYWPNVLEWCNSQTVEYYFAQNLMPLPIDQRYGLDDMKNIINVIKNGNRNQTSQD